MSNPVYLNGWGTITPICGNHTDKIEMILRPGGSSYVCPRCNPETLSEGERRCLNSVSLNDYMNAMNHLHEIVFDGECNNEEVNLTNYAWKKNGLDFKVLFHSGDKFHLSIYNRKAFRG